MNPDHCERSTIREAWVAIGGLPGPVHGFETTVIATAMGKRFPAFNERSTQLMQEPPVSDTPTPPRWFWQTTWDDGRWAMRWGHRLVALHRVIPEGDRYVDFSTTMGGTLEEWLQATSDGYSFLGAPPPATSAVFGYLNVFRLDAASADLSEWFRMNFAVDVRGAEQGLAGFELGAHMVRPELQAKTSVSLTAQATGDSVVVQIRTIAEKSLPDGLTFSDTAALLENLEIARTIAKETFFSFVTEKTLTEMGATNAV